MTRRTLVAARAVVPDPDHTGPGLPPLVVRPAHVHLDGAWITAVDVSPQTPAPPDADDVGDLLLTPAFVDAHSHLALSMLRGAVQNATAGNVVEDLFFRVERHLTAADVAAFTAVAAYEALLHGTACVWDHYYFPDAVLGALDEVGLAGVVAPPLQDVSGPGVDATPSSWSLTHTLAHDATLRARGTGVCLGPHATDTVSDELWRRVVRAAQDLDLPVHAHVAQSPEEWHRARARGAASPLDLLRRLGVLDAPVRLHLVHVLYASAVELGWLNRTRHTLVACPRAQAWFDHPSPVGAWCEAGLTWAVGTDGAASHDALDVRGELAALPLLRTADVTGTSAHDALLAGGGPDIVAHVRRARHDHRRTLADPTDALHRVWTLPGRAHPQLRCGAIAPGHLAHLALWDLSHPTCWPGTDPLRALAFGAVGDALTQLMVAGTWRTTRGAHAASLRNEPGWARARAEADARRAQLLQRSLGRG